MVIRFEKKYLEELYYHSKCSDKKHRYQPQLVRNYVRRIITLAEAPSVESLYQMNSLRYEVLGGDKKGVSSIRIDRQYRLEFTISIESEPLVTICSIADISNHYR